MGESYIGTRELGRNAKAVIDALNEHAPTVVTVSGKPKAIMIPVTTKTLEAELSAWRARKELRTAVAACRAHVRKTSRRSLSMKQIDAEIARARHDRRQRQSA